MTKRSSPLTDAARHRSTQTRKAMIRTSKSAQCPVCKRKSAIKRFSDGDFWLRVCRWCDYEKGGYLKLPE